MYTAKLQSLTDWEARYWGNEEVSVKDELLEYLGDCLGIESVPLRLQTCGVISTCSAAISVVFGQQSVMMIKGFERETTKGNWRAHFSLVSEPVGPQAKGGTTWTK